MSEWRLAFGDRAISEGERRAQSASAAGVIAPVWVRRPPKTNAKLERGLAVCRASDLPFRSLRFTAALGYAFAVWALVENRFFSSMVRIQTDRGHVVCDSGPYRIVRHPGYVGSMVHMAGSCLALGSWWALIVAASVAAVMVVRTDLEDRALQAELEGYTEYARHVRYRLLPWIW